MNLLCSRLSAEANAQPVLVQASSRRYSQSLLHCIYGMLFDDEYLMFQAQARGDHFRSVKDMSMEMEIFFVDPVPDKDRV